MEHVELDHYSSSQRHVALYSAFYQDLRQSKVIFLFTYQDHQSMLLLFSPCCWRCLGSLPRISTVWWNKWKASRLSASWTCRNWQLSWKMRWLQNSCIAFCTRQEIPPQVRQPWPRLAGLVVEVPAMNSGGRTSDQGLPEKEKSNVSVCVYVHEFIVW